MSSFYWSEQEMQQEDVFPSILAVGDSWFWYPFFGGSLVNHLGPIVATRSHVILARGNNGAEAKQYVDGKYASIIKTALRLWGDGLSAVFISGGGNDFAGYHDLRPLLMADCSGAADASSCFSTGAGGLQAFVDELEGYYRKLIALIRGATKPTCVIVMHTYDYPVPNGQGLGNGDGWLGPAFDDAKVPDELRSPCMRHLIDAFHDMLQKLAAEDLLRIRVVDSRGKLSAGDWANELHPTRGGFQKIAIQAWGPVLRGAGLAA